MFNTYHLQLAKVLSDQRESLHQNDASSRPLSVDYEKLGLLGEIAFAQRYLLPVDTTVRRKGDAGIDFDTPIGKIDVKTARKAFNLIIEQGKVGADIYVLAEWKDGALNFLGWEYGRTMAACPIKDFGYGILNHYKPARALRPMEELDELMLTGYRNNSNKK